MVDLETIAEKTKVFPSAISQPVKNAISNYTVDVSAGLIFYNPLMILGETFFASMEPAEVIKSRLCASAMQILFTRSTGKLRNFSANYFNITSDSPWYTKLASDVGATLVIQMPTYAAALYISDASFTEAKAAMIVGAGVTIACGRPFGKWMDYWRKLWGKEPAIKEVNKAHFQ
jgi:hypothetical protein